MKLRNVYILRCICKYKVYKLGFEFYSNYVIDKVIYLFFYVNVKIFFLY